MLMAALHQTAAELVQPFGIDVTKADGCCAALVLQLMLRMHIAATGDPACCAPSPLSVWDTIAIKQPLAHSGLHADTQYPLMQGRARALGARRTRRRSAS